MKNDLDELYERLALCQSKAASLSEQILFLGGQSVKCWATPIGPGAGMVYAELLQKPPVRLRAEIGMLVNEQRSILDALACILARRNGANDVSGVYFPITKTEAGYHDKLTQRKIRRLSEPDREAILKMEPWGSDNPEDIPALYFLHEADRVRKHQNLLQWACTGGVQPHGNGSIGLLETRGVRFEKIGEQLRLAFFRDVTMELGARFEIIYTEPAALDGRRVTDLLGKFNAAVQRTLDHFA